MSQTHPTVFELALIINPELKEKDGLTLGDFDILDLPMMGGCSGCGASIAAFNSHFGKNGYLIGACCFDEASVMDRTEMLVTWALRRMGIPS